MPTGGRTPSHSRSRLELVAILGILAFGAILRTVQYAARGSLWLDELAIAVNVVGRAPTDLLFRSLDQHQVAPPGFLALEELGTRILGSGEAGLRLFPWLASLAALPLFWRVAARYGRGVELLAGLSAFAASPALVWYGGNAKQYSGDVAATLLLLLFALRLDEGRVRTREAVVAGALGGLAILSSHPAVLVGFLLCLALALRRTTRAGRRRAFLVLAAGWGAGAATTTLHSLLVVSGETREFMQGAWSLAFPSPGGFLLRLPVQPYKLLAHFLIYVTPKSFAEVGFVLVFCALAAVGAWALARRRPRPFVLLAIPFAAAILGALVRLLPVHARVSLFVSPTFLVAAIAGSAEVRRLLPSRARGIAAVATLALFALPAGAVLLVAPPPYRSEESRPVLEEMEARWRSGDAVYVYGAASLAMRFYGPPVEWIAGSRRRDDPREDFRALDRFRGRPRVWFFATHGFPCGPEAIRSYLEAIGTEIDRIEDPYGNRGQRAAAAWLYDLSDGRRWSRADAETHDYPRAVLTGVRKYEGCDYMRRPGRSGL